MKASAILRNQLSFPNWRDVKFYDITVCVASHANESTASVGSIDNIMTMHHCCCTLRYWLFSLLLQGQKALPGNRLLTVTDFMDSFTQRLQSNADLVEACLANEIDCMQGVPERLRQAMRHAALGGGKRFRPFLVLECAAMFGANRQDALMPAAALEFIHCYSLVHDDLPSMDNDRLRRGRPTVWAAFDEWTAILAGDGLLTLAFEILARPTGASDAQLYSQLALKMARAAGAAGMVGGQCLDLESDKLGEPATPDAHYIQHMQALKTGALLRFACEAGAILARAPDKDCAAMQKFGDYIGFAFQIADDLLDIESTPEELGKATGKDQAAGKATLVELLGQEQARAKLNEIKAAALDLLAPYGPRARLLQEATNFIVTRRN